MIESEGISRIKLMIVVGQVMAIPEKRFKEWSKTSAPSPVTREGLLIDTLLAKGFRFTNSDEEGD